MRRISTTTKVTDKFGAGKHGFTNGNAVGGIPATDLEDVWFDHIQEEIAGVVEWAGLTLDTSNRAQLQAALQAKFAALAGLSTQTFAVASATASQHAVALGQFLAVFGATGSVRIPVVVGGVARTLIINWGSFTGSASADTPITFNTAFPNAFMMAVVSGQCSGTGAWGGYNSSTLSGMNGNWWSASGTRQAGNATYIALGW